MHRQLAPRSITLDDLELLQVRILSEFCRFGSQQWLNDEGQYNKSVYPYCQRL